MTEPTKDLSKSNLIQQFTIIIHKIDVDGGKVAVFKKRQYTDAIKIIKLYPKDTIDNLDDIKNHFIKNGKKNPTKILLKIQDFIENGYITQAKEAMENPLVKALMNLTKIYAIGPAKAKQLYNKHGITTIEDLRNKFIADPSIINAKQQIGLKYHNDLEQRIPRTEIDEYNIVLNKICQNISPDLKMSINGSYRRGLETSGDIDVLITCKNNSNLDTYELRQKLINRLKENGILQETLASGKKKFMGIVKLQSKGYNIARHIDIIDTIPEHYPFALLYFTGSGEFNSQMRAIALKQGYSMNEYRMTHKKTKLPGQPSLRGQETVPVSKGTIMGKIGNTRFEHEKDIFIFLDIKYIQPENRNVITLNKL